MIKIPYLAKGHTFMTADKVHGSTGIKNAQGLFDPQL